MAVISGEAGIGKTSFCERATADAERDGFDVVWGRCWPHAGAPALWPWPAVLADLIGASVAGLLADDPGAGECVAPERFARFAAVADRLMAEALSLTHHALFGPEHAGIRSPLADELITAGSDARDGVLALFGLLWRTIDLYLAVDRQRVRHTCVGRRSPSPAARDRHGDRRRGRGPGPRPAASPGEGSTHRRAHRFAGPRRAGPRFAASTERARTSVRKAIKRALDVLSGADPALGAELRAASSTGATCRYDPQGLHPRHWRADAGLSPERTGAAP